MGRDAVDLMCLEADNDGGLGELGHGAPARREEKAPCCRMPWIKGALPWGPCSRDGVLLHPREPRGKKGAVAGRPWSRKVEVGQWDFNSGALRWNFLGASPSLCDGEAELGEGSHCPLLAVE
jgi:hypothetical protein